MFVIKIGGNEIDDPEFIDRLGEAVATLTVPVIIVHGGGKEIRELRFINERMETDLTVTLSPKARWVSGRKQTAKGIDVCLNIPTFEVFTTPDWRGTTGQVSLTRPVMINGTLVEGLKIKFQDGEIVETSAEKNGSVYDALINTPGDPTAKRLGEVALVGVDSPIFQSRRIFQHIDRFDVAE